MEQIQKSALFSINSTHVGSSARINPQFITNLSHFIKSVSKTHPLHLSRTATPSTFRTLVVLFIGFLVMHDSNVMSKLYERSAFLHAPKFVIAPLLRIAVNSVTRNKISGFTTGKLATNMTFENIIQMFLDTNQLEWQSAFCDSEFVYLFETPHKFLNFKLGVLNILESLGIKLNTKIRSTISHLLTNCVKIDELDDESSVTIVDENGISKTNFSFAKNLSGIVNIPSDFDLVLFLQNLNLLYPSIFKYGDKVVYFDGPITIQSINDLGIYKFRSTSTPHIYYVQQSMLSKVSETSMDLFASFLRIFEPTFGEVGPIIAGDISITVEETPIQQAWDTYLNFSISDANTKESFIKKRSQPKMIRSDVSGIEQTPNPNLPTKRSFSSNIQKIRPSDLFFATSRVGIVSLSLKSIVRNTHPSFRIVRSYSSSTRLSVDFNTIVEAAFAAKAIKGTASCATPSAMYPDIDLTKAISAGITSAFKSTINSVLPSTLLVGTVVVSIGFVFFISKHINEIWYLASQYNQIFTTDNGMMIQYLNTVIPDLSHFNQCSAIKLHGKCIGILSLEQCEVLIRFYIHNGTHEIWGVLLDLKNGQANLP